MELIIVMSLSVEESMNDSKGPKQVSRFKMKQLFLFGSITSLVGHGNIAEKGSKSCSEVRFCMRVCGFTSHSPLTVFGSKSQSRLLTIIKHAY